MVSKPSSLMGAVLPSREGFFIVIARRATTRLMSEPGTPETAAESKASTLIHSMRRGGRLDYHIY